MATAVPELTTERLLLRAIREEDLDEYAAVMADPEVMRWLGSEPLDRAEAWRRMAYVAGHWMLRGYGHWALELRATGELVGNAGLYRPEGWPDLEVGWTLIPRHQGNGYATEAARAAVEWGWRELGARRIVSLIDPANDRSQAVARRLGMRLSGDVFPFKGHDLEIWELLRPD